MQNRSHLSTTVSRSPTASVGHMQQHWPNPTAAAPAIFATHMQEHKDTHQALQGVSILHLRTCMLGSIRVAHAAASDPTAAAPAIFATHMQECKDTHQAFQ
eukprot:1139071-Pelagomonas_calceolata.AAC.1